MKAPTLLAVLLLAGACSSPTATEPVPLPEPARLAEPGSTEEPTAASLQSPVIGGTPASQLLSPVIGGTP